MTGQPALGWGLAVVMLVVSVYCAGRLAAGLSLGRVERDADIGHVAMGAAMAGMLVPRLNPLPTIVWQVCFGFATAWFAWRALSAARHYTQHAVHGGAMLYMLTAAGRTPTALPLAAVLLGYAVWETDHLTAAPPDLPVIAPRLAGLCRIAIGVTMAYMLILTL